MTNLTSIIETDDLESFKLYFDINQWQTSITQIENYAGLNEYIKEISYNDCDCFKYALHCEADKIFNYLLPLVDVDKHGDNYGWPLLSMALKKNRYDYANSIISHSSFNPYEIYHTNSFGYIETKDMPEAHIEFLFNYLDIFQRWDFGNKHLIYCFTSLVCYDEKTFERFNQVYLEKLRYKDNETNAINMYKDHMDILAKEILYHKFNPFILDKLSEKEFHSLFKSILDDKIIFMPLFESEQAKEGLTYLLKEPELFQQYILDNPVSTSHLSLECILFIIDHGIDLWQKGEKNHCPVDYLLDYSNINEPITWHFINHYTQQVCDRMEERERDNNIYKYCQQKLFNESITDNKPKGSIKKL
jgi:hypothetical protein